MIIRQIEIKDDYIYAVDDEGNLWVSKLHMFGHLSKDWEQVKVQEQK